MHIKKFAAGAGATVMLVAGLGMTTASSAQSSVTTAPSASRSMPRIQTYSPYGWHVAHDQWKMAPSYVYFGFGIGYSAPRVKNIHWTYYRHGGAYSARARWLVDNCRPTCVQAAHYVNARVFFSGTQYHSGPGWYFSQFRVHWQGGKWSAYIDRLGQWNW